VQRDPFKYFRVEAREIVDGLAQGLLDLDKGAPPQEVVARLLRHAHTLKGAARVVKQARIAEVAHAIEEVLAPHREGRAAVPRADTARLLGHVQEIEKALASLGAPASAAGEAGVAKSAEAPPRTDERFETVRVAIDEMDALLATTAEAAVGVGSLRRQVAALDEAARAARSLATALGAGGGALSERARELAARLSGIKGDLVASLERTERSVTEVRDRGDRLRLVPASAVFATIERAVHDAASLSQKSVTFAASGGENQLDGYVLSALREALLHIARNAVVHGVEPESGRLAARKPRQGKIELLVARQGGQLRFRVRDDGRGLDVAAIGAAAIRAGRLTPKEADALTLEGAVALLLRGGVTTATSVTEAAGRGVGLDVVRDVVTRLKGSLGVASEPGRGTTIDLRVPISLSAVTALVVETAGTTCSVPLDAVVRARRLASSDVFRSGERDAILEEGETIPFAPLDELLGAGASSARTRRAWSAVIVRGGEDRVAIGADRILGVASVVVRALPTSVGAVPAVSGASLDEEGDPRLALDAPGVVAAVRGRAVSARATAPPRRPPVLVIDDSLTTRMLEQSILESAGYEVVLATSAEEGLEKARAGSFGVFVVDVEMPGMDGFEFVASTRRDPTLGKIPAILVTSRNAPEDRRRGVEVGAHAYIVKGEFDQGRLLAAIRELIG